MKIYFPPFSVWLFLIVVLTLIIFHWTYQYTLSPSPPLCQSVVVYPSLSHCPFYWVSLTWVYCLLDLVLDCRWSTCWLRGRKWTALFKALTCCIVEVWAGVYEQEWGYRCKKRLFTEMERRLIPDRAILQPSKCCATCHFTHLLKVLSPIKSARSSERELSCLPN